MQNLKQLSLSFKLLASKNITAQQRHFACVIHVPRRDHGTRTSHSHRQSFADRTHSSSCTATGPGTGIHTAGSHCPAERACSRWHTAWSTTTTVADTRRVVAVVAHRRTRHSYRCPVHQQNTEHNLAVCTCTCR